MIHPRYPIVCNRKDELTEGRVTMSICLDVMASDCARRLTAHDMMLRHLALDPGPGGAPRVLVELRGTLRACTACPTPGRWSWSR